MCQLGIMGSRYIRDEAVPAELTVVVNRFLKETLAIEIPDIYADPLAPISNVLAIRMRQASALPFITVKRYGVKTLIYIENQIAEAGEFQLVLESYDATSTVQSALKTDTINLIIQFGDAAPTFSEDLEDQPMYLGVVSSFQLPSVNVGGRRLRDL